MHESHGFAEPAKHKNEFRRIVALKSASHPFDIAFMSQVSRKMWIRMITPELKRTCGNPVNAFVVLASSVSQCKPRLRQVQGVEAGVRREEAIIDWCEMRLAERS